MSRKNPAAVSLGRRGGKKGGPARMAKLSAEERKSMAARGGEARWAKELRDLQDEVRRLEEKWEFPGKST